MVHCCYFGTNEFIRIQLSITVLEYLFHKLLRPIYAVQVNQLEVTLMYDWIRVFMTTVTVL